MNHFVRKLNFNISMLEICYDQGYRQQNLKQYLHFDVVQITLMHRAPTLIFI